MPANTGPALKWAADDEDARWRTMPRFGPVLWVIFTCAQIGQIVLNAVFGLGYATWLVTLGSIGALAGPFLVFISTSWTAAHSEGLRIRNGWRTHEVAWGDIVSVRRSRMWGFVLRTRDGGRHPLQGLTQARLGHLVRIWASHRGEEEARNATTTHDHLGLWAVEVRRFIGQRVALALVLVLVPVIGTFLAVFTEAPMSLVLTVAGLCFIALMAALYRVLLAGTVLSREGVKVRTLLRTRRVRWSAVRELSADGPEVALHTADGTSMPLVGVTASDLSAVERAMHEATAQLRSR